jgi:hypothetical protein
MNRCRSFAHMVISYAGESSLMEDGDITHGDG